MIKKTLQVPVDFTPWECDTALVDGWLWCKTSHHFLKRVSPITNAGILIEEIPDNVRCAFFEAKLGGKI